MKIEEFNKDIFTLSEDFYLAHCISSDYCLGEGIALEFQRKFKLRQVLSILGKHKYPDCILIGRVFNLVTKDKYWNKPTYINFTRSLKLMRNTIISYNISKLGIYKLGCTRDKLKWNKVKNIIENTFSNIDIYIAVCDLK